MRLTKGLKKPALPVSCRVVLPSFGSGGLTTSGDAGSLLEWGVWSGPGRLARGVLKPVVVSGGGAPAAATAPAGGLLDWASELCREQKKAAPEVSLMLVHVNGQHGMQHDTATSGHR
jgi:hypothetical protein